MALKAVPNKSNSGPRAVGAATNANSARGQLAPVGVTSAKFNRPVLREKRERWLIMADSNAGKSYAYFRMAAIDYALESNWTETDGERKYTGPRYWLFDFDDNAPAYLSPGEEFEHLYFENGGNVYPFPADDWEMAVSSFNYMRSYWRRGDWVIFDVVNRLYEMAQDLIAGATGVDIDEQTVARIIKGRGFGAFEPNQWNAVARSFLSIYQRTEDGPCNIICLCHTTEVIRARDKRTILAQFDQLGLRPKAPRAVIQDMDTHIALWVVRDIPKDKDGSARTVRWMTVLKDRGKPTYYRTVYNFDLYETLKVERTKPENNAINVTDPEEVARIMAETDAALAARDEAHEEDERLAAEDDD